MMMIKYRGHQYRAATPEETEQYQDVGFTQQGRWGNEGSGILYTTGERILLLKRSWEVEEPGTWGLPGGTIPEDHQGGGLDAFESAQNEVVEELGIMLDSEAVDQYVYEEPGFRYTTFICRVTESAAEQNFQLNWENDNFGWFARRDLSALNLHFGVIEVLQHLDPFDQQTPIEPPREKATEDVKPVDEAPQLERFDQHNLTTKLTAMAVPDATYGATVYHGSNEPDLDRLERRHPPYRGGIGGGIYVDADRDVAAAYGNYVYELKLLLRPDEIFYLEPNFIEELLGNSIVTGEEVYPFWFVIDDDRYAVVEGNEQPLDYNTFFAALQSMLVGSAEWTRWFRYVPHDKVVANDIWEQYANATTEDQRGQPMIDEDNVPQPNDIPDNFDDGVWNRLENLGLDVEKVGHDVESAMEAFTDEYLQRKNYGLSIYLGDVGAEVEEHGYKAVYLEDIRPMSELLVFDEADLEMVGLVEAE